MPGEAGVILMNVSQYDDMRESLAMLKILEISSREVQEGLTRDADGVLDEIASKLWTRRECSYK